MADPDRLLWELGKLARQQQLHEPLGAERHKAGRYRLVEAIAEGRRAERSYKLRRLGALAAAAAVVAAIAAVVVAWPPGALSYELCSGEAQLSEGGYVRAESSAAALRFSDGTTITLERGTAGRIMALTATGAQLLIEDGRAELEVVPKPNAQWSVAAGPYVVTVTGTRFAVHWNGAGQLLDVQLHEGSLAIRGPQAEQTVRLTAGQRLTASPRQRELRIATIRAPAAPPPSAEAPAPVVVGPVASAEAVAGSSSSAASAQPATVANKPRSWSQRVAEGDFQGVLDEARRQGIDSVIAQGSLDNLVALADAARYRGQSGVAGQALRAIRARFGGSQPAQAAAFLLGRMAEGGSPGTAIRYYDTYLAEAPGGPYAAEALGRKMMAVAQSSGSSAARGVAEQYLRLYPKGPFAAAAKKILKQ